MLAGETLRDHDWPEEEEEEEEGGSLLLVVE
jgi:hypothetical protein